ncbi:MAG: hypothetical protein E7387_08290 [Ruminococcaceae bacterium]|nr:hypothetical protein [Oscillospiraceae bacterium]
MKKTIIILGSIIFVFLAVFFSLYFILTAPKNADIFTVDKYAEYIQNENFQIEHNVIIQSDEPLAKALPVSVMELISDV